MLDDINNTGGGQNENLPAEFVFETQAIRTVAKSGEPWFVAADVCNVLAIKDASDAVERLDEDEKGICSTETLGGQQDLLAVNEFGLCTLILGSRKPAAKRFKRWITHEVLPAIRKTGGYETGEHEIDTSRRFYKIFAERGLRSDHRLKILFGLKIPFTGDYTYRFFADDACDALGFDDPDAILALLADSEKTFLDVETAHGAEKRLAITEPALYALAFTPKKRRLNGEDNNKMTRQDRGELNCLLLSHSLKMIEVSWLKFEDAFLDRRPDDPIILDDLDKTIQGAVRHADSFLDLYGGLRPRRPN